MRDQIPSKRILMTECKSKVINKQVKFSENVLSLSKVMELLIESVTLKVLNWLRFIRYSIWYRFFRGDYFRNQFLRRFVAIFLSDRVSAVWCVYIKKICLAKVDVLNIHSRVLTRSANNIAKKMFHKLVPKKAKMTSHQKKTLSFVYCEMAVCSYLRIKLFQKFSSQKLNSETYYLGCSCPG